jgi:molecular chaperone GrpE
LKATLKKIRKDLKQAQKEKQEYLTNWQKERADFQNYKKDEASRFSAMNVYAKEKFVEDLLPVLDAYDMAFSNKEVWEKVDKNWRTGVEYIHQQIMRVVSDYGVTPMNIEIGNSFDPNLHESVDTIETDDESKNHTIGAIIQSGYMLGTKVLRPARIKVFEFKK